MATGLTIHRAPSAGSVIKKVHEINPALGVRELSELIRQATYLREASAEEYAGVEVIDEEKALRLARESLRRS